MPAGYFALVLHAHLPFVRHPEDPTVMEEQWLYEGITGTYLPLVQMFEGLVADGVPYRCTVSLSAPLITMLTDDLLKERYARHLDRLIELAEKELERTRPEPHYHRLAEMYRDRFQSIRHTWRCPRGEPGPRVPAPPGGGSGGGHHLHRHPRLLSAPRSQLGGAARPGSRGGRSVRAALRVSPARHVARGVRLRAGRRRAAAGGGDPVLLRGHPRHPAGRPPPRLRQLCARLLPHGRGGLRARPRVVAAGLERARGLPRRPALPRFLPRHRIRPAARLHRPVHPPGRPPDVHRHQVPRDHPRAAARQVGVRSRHRAAAGRGARGALPDGATAAGRAPRGQHGSPPDRRQPLRCGAVRPLVVRGTDLPRRSLPPAPLRPAGGRGDHARRLPRPAPDQPGRDPVHRPRGGGGGTPSTGSTRATHGSTATCTWPASAWSSWRIGIPRPRGSSRGPSTRRRAS